MRGEPDIKTIQTNSSEVPWAGKWKKEKWNYKKRNHILRKS